jgi:hypothetical protein
MNAQVNAAQRRSWMEQWYWQNYNHLACPGAAFLKKREQNIE